jgi:hypothetical protein
MNQTENTPGPKKGFLPGRLYSLKQTMALTAGRFDPDPFVDCLRPRVVHHRDELFLALGYTGIKGICSFLGPDGRTYEFTDTGFEVLFGSY